MVPPPSIQGQPIRLQPMKITFDVCNLKSPGPFQDFDPGFYAYCSWVILERHNQSLLMGLMCWLHQSMPIQRQPSLKHGGPDP